jgi:hypothetical protein
VKRNPPPGGFRTWICPKWCIRQVEGYNVILF